MVRLTVKPTAGGQKIELPEADLTKTVLELKEELSPSCNIPASEQRLVWRGQILKDERTLDSYGTWRPGRGASSRLLHPPHALLLLQAAASASL
jgi:hypothetical protein